MNMLPEFQLILPEIFVLTMIVITLLTTLFIKENKGQIAFILSQATLVGALLLTIDLFSASTVITFYGHFIVDPLSNLLKIFIYITTFFALIYSKDYIKQRGIAEPEYYLLILFALLGMMILVSSYNFITLYLGLELLSLPLYALVALQRDSKQASEAAVKYFVMGALASGFLLYGLSMLYGATGSLDIAVVTQVIATELGSNTILQFALVFVVVGIAFKFGAVPFHLWVPDVYQGAPTSVTLFIGSAPKLATLGMAFRLLVDALPQLHLEWMPLLVIIAILSIAIGNIVAIAQTNIKRMLAYSSIAHMGYMVLGLIAGNQAGYDATIFYLIVYAIMSLGAFGMIIVLSKAGFEAENIDDFKGLNQRNPWFAFMMLIIMFSMAGVPPTAGFIAKLGVLQALVVADMVWLAAVALVLAVVGAYYYLRIVKVIYFDDSADSLDKITVASNIKVFVSINALALLFLGIMPSVLFSMLML